MFYDSKNCPRNYLKHVRILNKPIINQYILDSSKKISHKLEQRLKKFQQDLLNLDTRCKSYSTLNCPWNYVRTLLVPLGIKWLNFHGIQNYEERVSMDIEWHGKKIGEMKWRSNEETKNTTPLVKNNWKTSQTTVLWDPKTWIMCGNGYRIAWEKLGEDDNKDST